MREPLPLACRTSAAYAAGDGGGRRRGEGGRKAAWESGWRFPQEDAEPEHRLVFGGELTFAELLEEPARPDEDWDDEEPLALRPSCAPPLGRAADAGSR